MFHRLRFASLALVIAGALLSASTVHAGSSIPQQTLQAMQSVHSYEITMDAWNGNGSTGKPTEHMDAIVIRQGKFVEMYAKVTTSMAQGQGFTMEMVINSTHTCTRMTSTAAWHCSAPIPGLSSLMNYTDITKTFHGHFQLSALGSKVVQGQPCDGYTITSSTLTGTGHGILWLSQSTKRVVEEDFTASNTVVKGSAPSVSTIKLVFSHYNDAALSIPAVSGA
jgi:hypothetical protein